MGYDGEKLLVYPKIPTSTTPLLTANTLKISSNPIGVNDVFEIKMDDAKGTYRLELFSSDGKLLLSHQGDVEQLNFRLQEQVTRLKSGIYLLRLRDREGSYWEAKVVRP